MIWTKNSVISLVFWIERKENTIECYSTSQIRHLENGHELIREREKNFQIPEVKLLLLTLMDFIRQIQLINFI